jgi:hypothetical protein
MAQLRTAPALQMSSTANEIHGRALAKLYSRRDAVDEAIRSLELYDQKMKRSLAIRIAINAALNCS